MENNKTLFEQYLDLNNVSLYQVFLRMGIKRGEMSNIFKQVKTGLPFKHKTAKLLVESAAKELGFPEEDIWKFLTVVEMRYKVK